ncbi:MAG TPA: hypothetical protein VHI95_14220 [Acidimicrobiales bacterium]|jgi:hypothetical protein|nr:hypothetical protein [Acidimicrobiales bacterium]
MRRVCFVRFELGADAVTATAVGVGHRLPAECAVSVSQGLRLAQHYPVVIHRVGHTTGSAA